MPVHSPYSLTRFYPNGHGEQPPLIMKLTMPGTLATLSLSSILWMIQLAIRLSCQRPQPSRWLSRKRGERSEGGEARQTNRYTSFTF